MIRHLLNMSVDIYRATPSDDGQGGTTRALTQVGTVRARVSQPTATERAVAAQMGAVVQHVVHVAYTTDVERGDEIDTGAYPYGASSYGVGPRRLRVQSVVSDSSATYKRLECQVIQPGV